MASDPVKALGLTRATPEQEREVAHDECRITTAGTPARAAVMRFLEELRSRTRCWVQEFGGGALGVEPGPGQRVPALAPVDSNKAQAVRLPPGARYG
ncbi:MAG: hypothetical protein K6T75_02260 [Acetobacteraceae bacterium]|nr:hypothetical protein [Acetobacteraceae bacterium]